MNDRQFYALMNPCRDLEEATRVDYVDVIRSPSGAVVQTHLTAELWRGIRRWHAVAMILDPRTRELAELTRIPFRLHGELKTIAARLAIGVGRDPSDIHASKYGWHVYRLLTVDEVAMIPPPPLKVVEGPVEPLIVRPDGRLPGDVAETVDQEVARIEAGAGSTGGKDGDS